MVDIASEPNMIDDEPREQAMNKSDTKKKRAKPPKAKKETKVPKKQAKASKAPKLTARGMPPRTKYDQQIGIRISAEERSTLIERCVKEKQHSLSNLTRAALGFPPLR